MRLLYHIGIASYSLLLQLASLLGHKKATLWILGRKDWRSRIALKFKDQNSSVWVHCASLGEYELSVPLIKQIKAKHPAKHIIVTFFSPSGYEIKKNDSSVFHVDYLPIDSAANAKDFIRLIKPEVAFFAKYDYWFHYLNELKKQNVPTYVFSASFRPSQVFFKTYGNWYRKMLLNFTKLFVIDEQSVKLLQSININNVQLTGDTRYDRVSETAASNKIIEYIDDFKTTQQLIVAGSTWPEDESLLARYINECDSTLKIIIAPHEVDNVHIDDIEKRLTVKNIRYSQINSHIDISSYRVIIVDNIGMLSALYKYGNIAYVGGAFKQGLHNILEPLSFGLPVIFGPNIKRFPEAQYFSNAGGAFAIETYEQLVLQLNKLKSLEEQAQIKNINISLITQHIGSTNKILNNIEWKN
jgi:3-deoxy-D-manno-octulosonic-acid transferase